MHLLMSEGKSSSLRLRAGNVRSLAVAVTNEESDSTASAVHQKPASTVRKRKPTRVKTLIKSSVDKFTQEDRPQPNAKKPAASSSIDKRPFPFGQW